METVTLGVDIGGTRIKRALVVGGTGNSWEVREVDQVPTPQGPARGQATVRVLRQIIATQRRRFGAGLRVGVGIPGLVERGLGVVLYCPNLGWCNLPLASLLDDIVPRSQLAMGNDATVAALAIHRYEFRGRYRNMIVLTLGTGVGGGLVLDGVVYGGAQGFAGELGHVTVDPDGPRCNCGNRGCLERLIGGQWLVHDTAQMFRTRSMPPILQRLTGGDPDTLSPELLCAAACQGDRFSRDMWKKFGTRLGVAVASLVNVLNPDAVVLTGGVAAAHRWFLPSCTTELRRRSFPRLARNRIGAHAPAAHVKLLVSRNPQHLGVIGAGILAHTIQP